MLPLNEIVLGDCLEVMRSLPDSSIDLILCDLPYGTTTCKWDSVIPFEPLWEQYKRLIKPGRAIVLTASQPFTTALVASNIQWFKHEWIWEKNRGSNFASARFQPMKEHESVLVFGQGKVIYNPIFEPRSPGGRARAKYQINPCNTGKREACGGFKESRIREADPASRTPRSIQKFNTEVGFHPTQKPVALFSYLIKTYSNPGDIVLDNCIGSGTTALAAIETGRNFIGIERDPGYHRIASDRLSAAMTATASTLGTLS